MQKEVITTGKTIEEAVEQACAQLGVSEENCDVEILEKPKKSLFGKIKAEAKVKVTVKESVTDSVSEEKKEPVVAPPQEEPEKKAENSEEKIKAAVSYLSDILKQMGLDQVEIQVDKKEDSAVLTLAGDDLGILIGRHGETLDSLQYLASLVCNRVEGSYFRITLDCGNYREKREQALKELAKKISGKVKRTGRSQSLEPMNPYERRIIHVVISDIDGVTSKSKGEEPNRRVVILSTSKPNRGGYHKRSSYQNRKPEKTMEEILKAERSETEQKAKLYSKIEL
jgi:spoIIIJ-associated protein